MEEFMVTVVVPIYNVEKYLDRCLNSIVHQTYKNLEILLVDDGSSDRCPEICEEWKRKDPRIKIIHKENAGLGMARNTGIENASGEYICFFDSDDYVEPQTIACSVAEAKKTNADVVVFGLSDLDQNGKILQSFPPHPPKQIYSGKEVQEELLPMMFAMTDTNLRLSACVMLFSMRMIRKAAWRFVSEREIISEDLYSLVDLFSSINRISFIPQAFYNYCRNQASLSHTYRKDRYEKIKFFYDACIKMCAEKGYNQKVQNRVGLAYLSFTIAAMKQIVLSNAEFRVKFKEIKSIVQDRHLHQVISRTDLSDEKRSKQILYQAVKRRRSAAVFMMIIAACIKNG